MQPNPNNPAGMPPMMPPMMPPTAPLNGGGNGTYDGHGDNTEGFTASNWDDKSVRHAFIRKTLAMSYMTGTISRSAAESDVVESDTEEGAAEPASSEAGVSAESVRVELDTVGTTEAVAGVSAESVRVELDTVGTTEAVAGVSAESVRVELDTVGTTEAVAGVSAESVRVELDTVGTTEAVAGVSAESVRVELDTVGTTEAVAEPEVAGQGVSDREQVCGEVKEGSEGGDELQVSEQTGIGMVIEGVGVGEVGSNEDVAFKFPKRKRIRKVQHSDSPAKCGMSLGNVASDERAVMEVEGSVPKKGVGPQALEHDSADSDGEEGGSDTDSLCSYELSASQQARGGYSAQSIQKFLEFVKDRRGINVRDHFPDVMLFVGSANQVMRDAAVLGLEKKEKDRLKYWISKVRASLKKSNSDELK
ncbi:UNVERIFIED_CONTAM: hypothetical protein FKN15_071198 [Acipenser sinensis]